MGLGEMKNALDCLNEALKIYRSTLKDLAKEAWVIDVIGFVYSQIGESEIAFKYYNQALEIQRQRKDLLRQAEILRKIGSLQSKLGKYELAMKS
ncbi:hypothetical protein WA1_06330 [Scytonema hofmannii PCC 7110]|uniref:Uncharacterized protein n=2 Tax=Scytonema hofmannii TaxID=34078 RepID=A0A139WSN4_9CYAN|nr:hypothetical protein WA1_06330 [Scytonema hofmannii PCC 7110]